MNLFILSSKYQVDQQWKWIYGLILIMAQVSAMIVPLMYWKSKKCRHHPAQMEIGILEMIATYQLYFWSICLTDVLKFFYIHELIAFYTLTTLRNIEYMDEQMCWWNQSIYFICIFAQLSYYIVLSVDLIITLKKPFFSSKSRLLYYHGFVLMNTGVFFWMTVGELQNYCDLGQICDQTYIHLEYDGLIYLQCFLFFIAVVACIYGIIDIVKVRDSLNYRRQYFINHMLMILALFIMWLPPILYNSFGDLIPLELYKYLVNICFCFLLAHRNTIFIIHYSLLAIIFLLIRLREPYFKFRFKFFILSFFGKTTWFQQKEVQDIEDQVDLASEQWNIPLNQLVQTSSNQETVANILKSILLINRIRPDSNFGDLKKMCRQIQKFNISHKSDSHQGIPNAEPLLYTNSISEDNSVTLEYQVISYAPKIFKILRENEGIYYENFQQSLKPLFNQKQIRKTQESLGKSGSFFFFSHDKRLILKTLTYQELELITKRYLPVYYNYIINNKNSLIAKIYGAYTLNLVGLSSIHLVLMENTMQFLPKEGTRLYDLKGSLINRYVKVHKVSLRPNLRESSIDYVENRRTKIHQEIPIEGVLKDVNLLESEDLFIQLSKDKRQLLFDQLKHDTEFLKKLGIMDYSMLVGVRNEVRDQKTHISFRQLITDNKVYSFSVIDFTQRYTLAKQIENKYKIIVRGSSQMISCVDPEFYQQRFMSFFNSIIVSVSQYD